MNRSLPGTSAGGVGLRVQLPDGAFEARPPQLRDGVAWSAARLANREWLERAFPAWGDDWEAEQSETAWAQRWWHLRTGALRGRAVSFVILVDGNLVGEIGVDAVDGVSGAGEASAWMVRSHGSPAVMYAASLALIRAAFTGRHPVDRLISPVAVSGSKGRAPGLRAVGLTMEGTVARRVGGAGFVEHDMWIIHNTPATRAEIAAKIAALQDGGA